MSEVRRASRGKWFGILTALAVDKSFLSGKNGPCPMCGGKDRWRWTDYNGEGRWICNHCGKGDGFDLLARLNGWDFATAAKEVERIVGAIKPDARPKKADPTKRIASIRAGLVKSHVEVVRYLAGRGLNPPPGIAAHPELAYYEGRKVVGHYPAMVAGIKSPDGKLVSLHLTYIQDGRKAPVSSPRKMLPPAGSLDGAAIRLFKPAEVMGIAEGIETACAAAALFRIPVWSAINTTLMEKWVPPECAKRIIVFADHDRNFAGHRAAYALAFRLANAGLSVDVRVPPDVGDWNDVLCTRLRKQSDVSTTSRAAAICGANS